MAKKQIYYPFLDGFRAWAVLGVIGMHGIQLLHHPNFVIQMFRKIFTIGHLGVDVFFVLSGFLITGVLIEDWNKQIRILRFYGRRAFKILPSYLTIVSLCFYILITTLQLPLYEIFENRELGLTVLGHFLFFQNFFDSMPMLGHTWSLAIEEQFYLTYPLLVWGVFSVCKKPETRRSTLVILSIVTILLVLVNRMLGSGSDYVGTTLGLPKSGASTLIRIDGLVFGCLLKYFEPHFSKFYDKKDFWGLMFFVLGMLIYIFFILSGFNDLVYGYTWAYFATVFLILSAYLGFRPLLWLSEGRFVRMIGRNSYGIYLTHLPVIHMIHPWLKTTNHLWLFVVYTLCSVVSGIVLTSTIERYFLGIRKRVLP